MKPGGRLTGVHCITTVYALYIFYQSAQYSIRTTSLYLSAVWKMDLRGEKVEVGRSIRR